MDNTEDLRLLLLSRYPLVVAEMSDETRFMQIVRSLAAGADLPVWTWSSTRGLARDGNAPQYGTTEPKAALDHVALLRDPGVFIFADAHPALRDPAVVRRVKELGQAEGTGKTVILTTPHRSLPPELVGIALPWKLAPPSREELGELVRRTIANLSSSGVPVSLRDADVGDLVEAVRGLSGMEAEQLVRRAALRDGALAPDDVAFVRGAKADLLEAGGALELISTDHGSLEDVGGMAHLKEWLAARRRAFEPEAADFGLDPPRGVLITGVPGCGKSLVAKTLARTWAMPLVLLDPARLLGPYVGESEQRLEEALSTVQAMAPAVLWIDEIEKGFASGGTGDAGVSRRLIGTFLRWMQDRPPGVFVAATCNDVSALPPELLRKGRFDEVFFVDLPHEESRREILALHLRRRRRKPSGFDLVALARASDGFSGAELEAAVVGALYRAFAKGEELTTEILREEILTTVPLARSRAEDVQRLRSWSRTRAVAA